MLVPLAGRLLSLAAVLAADGATPVTPATSGGGPGVHLSWVRGEGAGSCPDANAIEAEVAGRLGDNPFARPPTQFIEAVVTARPDGHQVHIAMRVADGKLLGNRSLTSTAPDCRSVATAAALTIAIMIDPDVLARAPVPVPPPPPAPPPEPAQPPPAPAANFPPGRVTALVGAGWGLLPGVAPGAGLAATTDVARRAAVGVSTVFFPERRTAAPDDGFAFGLAYAQLVGCFVLTRPTARVRWELCAGGRAGVLHAVVFSAEPTGPGQRWTFAIAELIRVIIPVWGAAALEIGVDTVQPLPRRAFFVEGRPAGMDTVFTQPVSAFTGWMGVGLRWR
jgi:hypothetical protein